MAGLCLTVVIALCNSVLHTVVPHEDCSERNELVDLMTRREGKLRIHLPVHDGKNLMSMRSDHKSNKAP